MYNTLWQKSYTLLCIQRDYTRLTQHYKFSFLQKENLACAKRKTSFFGKVFFHKERFVELCVILWSTTKQLQIEHPQRLSTHIHTKKTGGRINGII